MEGNPDGAHQGTVMAIRGSGIEARFPQPLPALYHVLRAGDQQRISPAMRGKWSCWRTRSEELRAQFRQQRQLAITTELLDIVAGFEALTGASGEQTV